jgi:hypothetical protein
MDGRKGRRRNEGREERVELGAWSRNELSRGLG